MEFKDLNLEPLLLENLTQAGFQILTQIQEKAIPHALEGKDIAGLAQTGTGKTLAFLVPSIHFLITEKPNKFPYLLILAPTRELVLQIADVVDLLLKNTNYKVISIIGGTDYKEQEEILQQSPSVIVATPGRLIDFIKNRSLDISPVQIVVVDEADRMFDMGFIQDLKYIIHKTKNRKQTHLFSATLSYEIIKLAYRYLKDPIEIQIDPEKIISERIEQQLYHLGSDEKLAYLVNMILNTKIEGLGIIFTNYKSRIPTIINTLHKYGIPACGISSDFNQNKRIRLLRDFKLGRYKYLVATDVASRGIDVTNIDIVFNYDLPSDSENYVHRIGRTARAGRLGKAISFCSETDYQDLERIEKYLKFRLPVFPIQESYLEFPKGEFQEFKDNNLILKPHKKKSIHPRKKQRLKSNVKTKKVKYLDRKKDKPKYKKEIYKDPDTIRKRRNLFNKDEYIQQTQTKKSIWKKIKNFFGFSS